MAAWVEAHFDASRRGKKVLNPSRDKNARHVCTVAGREKKSLLCDPGSGLRLGGSWTRMAKIINGTRNKKKRRKTKRRKIILRTPVAYPKHIPRYAIRYHATQTDAKRWQHKIILHRSDTHVSHKTTSDTQDTLRNTRETDTPKKTRVMHVIFLFFVNP